MNLTLCINDKTRSQRVIRPRVEKYIQKFCDPKSRISNDHEQPHSLILKTSITWKAILNSKPMDLLK